MLLLELPNFQKWPTYSHFATKNPPATIARRFLALVAGGPGADPPAVHARRFLALIAGGPGAEETS